MVVSFCLSLLSLSLSLASLPSPFPSPSSLSLSLFSPSLLSKHFSLLFELFFPIRYFPVKILDRSINLKWIQATQNEKWIKKNFSCLEVVAIYYNQRASKNIKFRLGLCCTGATGLGLDPLVTSISNDDRQRLPPCLQLKIKFDSNAVTSKRC